ncbi:hypothetical protein [Streptomyces melanosporofaciens]|uniref:hypothetical protein n=1 Tax=Streptomyces melanosporofaciens TaxID=67327 RepID=UPI000B23C77A|nr:hypothetical protein [Streptomyces melanosporofaciens]
MDLTTLGAGDVREAHERFEAMQAHLNDGDQPPSERLMARHRQMFGREYRLETEGEHPAPSRRSRD